MFPTDAWANKPKRLEALEDAIFNGAAAPEELQKYIYRREFGLSAEEMESEPIDQLFMNLTIYALIKKKEEIMNREANRG